MPFLKKILTRGLILIAAILIGFGDYYLWRLVSIATGLEAKMLCSSVFISNRSPESVLSEDLHRTANFIRGEVDIITNTVSATAFGMIKREAVFRSGLGSTLLSNSTEGESIEPVIVDLKPLPRDQKTYPWPIGDRLSEESQPSQNNQRKLKTILDNAFSEPDPGNLRKTRAVVIVHKDQIIAERYAPGFSTDTPLLGYSMAKSAVNALVGILVQRGKLSLDMQAPVPEWDRTDDPRRSITLNHLMQMTSGLMTEKSLDVNYMLFGCDDMAAYSASRTLEEKPGTAFSYSNGGTNIIARIIRSTFEGSDNDYYAFPRRALFDPLGMRSAIIEPDQSGTFVGSTFMYASARDWSRLGLLYLHDGVWEGERLLPEGWVEYSRIAVPSDPAGEHGAHFMTNAGKRTGASAGSWPSLPADAFFAIGHNGQSLTIIPSLDLVVVRLGMTHNPEAWNLDSFISDIIGSLNAD